MLLHVPGVVEFTYKLYARECRLARFEQFYLHKLQRQTAAVLESPYSINWSFSCAPSVFQKNSGFSPLSFSGSSLVGPPPHLPYSLGVSLSSSNNHASVYLSLSLSCFLAFSFLLSNFLPFLYFARVQVYSMRRTTVHLHTSNGG